MNNYLSVFLLLSLLLSACTKDCIEGDGNLTAKTIQLESFTKIKNKSTINIKLVESDELMATISGDSNIVEVVTLNVSGETLNVDIDAGCTSSTGKIDVTLKIPSLQSIENNGTGDISGSTRFVNPIFKNTGTGQVELRGSGVDQLTVENTGTGVVILYELPTENATVENGGTGDTFVKVNTALDVKITGTGNVYYRGMPTITSDLKGTGNLIEDN